MLEILKNKFVLMGLLFIVGLSVYAQQTGEISGKVSLDGDLPFMGAEIVLENTDFYSYSDLDGAFSIKHIPAGKYKLVLNAIGFKTIESEVNLGESEKIKLNFLLEESRTQLDEVIIQGKTQTQRAKEQTVTAKVVDIKTVSREPATVADLMNRSAGIRIRESGGLGNNTEVSINGFQGKSVRYFKDGIPLDYLGDGYNISNLPLNSLERVDVYKGVLPVSLGSDALGGAVNLVTNNHNQTDFNASYQFGSFNTHRVSATGNYINPEKDWYVGGEAFFNYSDNDYTVTARVPDPDTKVPYWEKVRLFHNGYQSYYAEAYTGFKNRTWADDLQLSIATYGIDRDQQHPTLMTDAYGAIALEQQSVIPSLRYKKAFLDKKLKLDQFISYNEITKQRVDTLHGKYDWHGNFTPNPHRIGESPQPSNSKVHYYNLTSRTNLVYDLTYRNQLEGNLVLTRTKRKGRDPLGIKFKDTDIDVLTLPATYAKITAGLGWNYQIIEQKLTNSLNVKYYGYESKGVDGFRAVATELDKIQGTKGHSWGVADGIKYEINRENLVRLSAEYAQRLPDQDELFGDSDTRVPNFDLKPERSLNLNLNYRLQKNKYQLETGLYYRQTKGMILLIPIQSPFAQYQNLENVRGLGFDVDFNAKIWRFLNFEGNLTYLNNRMYGITDPVDLWKNDSRLRNTPFFFYNLGLRADFKDVFGKGDFLTLYSHYNFVREFYLNFIPKNKEPDGFLGLWGSSKVDVTTKIPDQHLVSLGANYKLGELPIHIGAEIKNITNAKLYDFYRVQKAGRSFQIKISYSLN